MSNYFRHPLKLLFTFLSDSTHFCYTFLFRQPDLCLICFDVENMTSVSMNVECAVENNDPETAGNQFSLCFSTKALEIV